MFFYSDTEVKTIKGRGKYENLDACKHYLRHFGNKLYLDFILKHSDTSWSEKRQAQVELVICDRKLVWWKRHPNWNQQRVEQGIKELRKQWEVPNK